MYIYTCNVVTVVRHVQLLHSLRKILPIVKRNADFPTNFSRANGAAYSHTSFYRF